MNRLHTLALSFALALAATASPAATLEIEISGLKSGEGEVMVAVYAGADSWMKKPLRGVAGKPSADGRLVLRVDDLPDGDYALSLMHDLNGNGRMDMNLLGIPTEPFAFSNNASGNFGPPRFEQARFSLSGSATQRIAFQ